MSTSQCPSRSTLVTALRLTTLLESGLRNFLGEIVACGDDLTLGELREMSAHLNELLAPETERLERALNEEALLAAAAPPSHEPPSAHAPCRNAPGWDDAIKSHLE
jgi:hypothetical protein